MYLEINDKTTLNDIQETFSNYYPYLKIEFFWKAHKKYEASSEENKVDPNIAVGDLKRTHVSGVLEIQPLYRVAEVEKEFLERFGLSVQIFRKEKDYWEQTTGMDDFTLKQLNEFGRSSSDEWIVSDFEEKFQDLEEKPEKLL